MSYGNIADVVLGNSPMVQPGLHDVPPGTTTLVVGLGNPILGDDGIGWRVAEAVVEELAARGSAPAVEVECLALGGLSLMERLVGYKRAIIVDAVQTADGRPGTVYTLSLNDLPDLSAGHTTAIHDTSLQNALRLGRSMGASLPEEIDVVAVEAERVYDFSEALTPAVAAAVPEATNAVLLLLRRELEEQHGLT